MEEHQRRALAQRLKQLRLYKGWNAEDLAHAAGVSVRTLSRLETAQIENPRESTVKRLAKALTVTREELAGPRVTPEEVEHAYENQLDRIESKLNELLALLEPSLASVFDAPPVTPDEQPARAARHANGTQAAVRRKAPKAS